MAKPPVGAGSGSAIVGPKVNPGAWVEFPPGEPETSALAFRGGAFSHPGGGYGTAADKRFSPGQSRSTLGAWPWAVCADRMGTVDRGARVRRPAKSSRALRRAVCRRGFDVWRPLGIWVG